MIRALFLSRVRNVRAFSNYGANKSKNYNSFLFLSSACISLFGLIYAAVPLYRTFCQQTGFAGTPKAVEGLDPEKMKPIKGAKPIRVSFVTETSNNLGWKFYPEQKSVLAFPGQSSLVFFSAQNMTDDEVTGIATYTVIPGKAAQYFNKIQCFCFEEQTLGPNEQVDMPVFWYIDPDFSYDSGMDSVGEITLCYTFFKNKPS